MRAHRRLQLGDLGLAPNEAGGLRPQVPWTRIDRPQGRELCAQAGRSDLEQSHRGGQIPQPSRPQIEQIDSAEQTRRRLGHQHLAAMARGHHTCGAVQHRTEIIRPPQLGFTGRQPHPHRQLQRPLRGHRGVNRTPRRGERRTHPVAGVLEQPAAVRLDHRTQHLVMGGQRHPHPLGIRFPPTGRTLHIGEQKRHHPRRSSRRSSGHPRRISQQTRSYLVHRLIRPQTPTPPRHGVARYPLAGSQRRYGTCWRASGDTILT